MDREHEKKKGKIQYTLIFFLANLFTYLSLNGSKACSSRISDLQDFQTNQ